MKANAMASYQTPHLSPNFWPYWTCQADPRFCYSVYVPSRRAKGPRPLMVMVHGSGRVADTYRNLLADTAERLGAVLLCPLFPCGLATPDDTESYKFVYWPGLRYDQILLAMIAELAAKVSIDPQRFFLAGYSGGGQFAHRFLYGHADRLLAVSIGAPGAVTLLDPNKPWWVGTAGLRDHLGFDPDLEAIRRVKVQMVIGGADDEDMTSPPQSPHFMAGINDAGVTRLERIAALQASFVANGVGCELITVAGVAHDGYALLDPVRRLAEACFGH